MPKVSRISAGTQLSEKRGQDVFPAYQRIKNSIRRRIDSGELNTGDRIESERELAVIHGVSLMTARHALQELDADGIVTRHVGVGTFVASPKIQFNRLVGFSELMGSRGLAVQSKLLSYQVIDDNEEVAARLRQPFGSKLIKIERLRLGGSEPFALESGYLPYSTFPDLKKHQLERRSLFDIFQREYHLALAYADEEVDATTADPRSARYLQIAPGSPVLRIRKLLYATNGDPILYDIGLYRSERHSLMIRRYR